MKIYLKYDESTSGGEICEGQENDSWPSYEPVYTEWHLSGCSITKSNGYNEEQKELDNEKK